MMTMRRWSSSKEISPTPLIDAVKMTVGKPKKGLKQLEKAIKSHPDMNQSDPAGFTAMMHAARFNLPRVILQLSQAGANVNLRSDDGNTPFHYACYKEHWTAMAMLIRLGANPDAVDANGRTPLIRAIECQDEKLVCRLLELGASPQACGENDVTPMFAALSLTGVVPKYSNTSIVRRLLDAGCDVNTVNKNGSSPLSFVCVQHRQNAELIDVLLQHGATVNMKDTYGRTPLTHCLRTDIDARADSLAILLRAGADPNVVDRDGHTSLSIWALNLNSALTYGHSTGRDHQRTLSQLLTCGANPNIVTNVTSPDYLMYTIVCHERYNEARALLAAGAEPLLPVQSYNECQQPQKSALLTVLLKGNLHLAKLLADGLFYTQNDIKFLSRLCAPTNRNVMKLVNTKGKSPTGGYAGRLSKSGSRPDLIDLNANLINAKRVSLGLDANANTTTTSFRRCQSTDTLLSSDLSSTNTQFQDKEIPTALSNDSIITINEKSKMLKKSQSTNLDLDMKETILKSELEDRVNVDPKTRHFIEELCVTVPSLKALSRRSIHRALRCSGDRTIFVDKLPVKPSLRRYILFEMQEQVPLSRFQIQELSHVETNKAHWDIRAPKRLPLTKMEVANF